MYGDSRPPASRLNSENQLTKMSQEVKYEGIRVQLSGADGNAFSIIGRVSRALRANGIDTDKVNEFKEEAMSGDYNHVLVTCGKWVSVD